MDDQLAHAYSKLPGPPATHVPPRHLGRWQLRVDDHDAMRIVTYLSLAGVVAAVVLSLIGGMPFDLPMPTHRVGWVEPTCGLTRGATAITRGHFAIAWRYNPAAFVVMAFGGAGVVRTVVGTVTGRWVNFRIRIGRLGWVGIVIAIVIALIGLWAYQQQHAAFIISSHVI